MAGVVQRRWRGFWLAFFAGLICIAVAEGALVTLVAKVTYQLLDTDGNPLADGSPVYIIGAGTDNQIGTSGSTNSEVAAEDQMISWGGTNYLGYTTLGDDEIIGVVTIGTGTDSNGVFFTASFEFDDTQHTHFYIRFFDTLGIPPGTYTNWNNSQLYPATNHPFGVEFVDFAPEASITTVQTNSFVVIPEPGSGSLFLLFAGLLWGMRLAMKKPEAE